MLRGAASDLVTSLITALTRIIFIIFLEFSPRVGMLDLGLQVRISLAANTSKRSSQPLSQLNAPLQFVPQYWPLHPHPESATHCVFCITHQFDMATLASQTTPPRFLVELTMCCHCTAMIVDTSNCHAHEILKQENYGRTDSELGSYEYGRGVVECLWLWAHGHVSRTSICSQGIPGWCQLGTDFWRSLARYW